MIMDHLHKAVIAGAMIVASSTASAVTIDSSDIGNSFTLNYNGFNNPDGLGGLLNGLTAEATFTLDSLVDSVFTFSYTLANTSSPPVTASRVSAFGFDSSILPTDVTTGAGDLFDLDSIGDNLPNITGSDTNRVCFRTSGGQCNGAGGDGIDLGDLPVSGSFALEYAPGTNAIDLDRFFVRYQSLLTSQSNAQSAVGLGNFTISAAPDAATWMSMLLGFGLAGAALRRSRAVSRLRAAA